MKQRPWLEMEGALLRPIHLGTGQIARQQIRRELNAVKVRFDTFTEHPYGPGFGQSWRPFHEQVPVAQQRQQQTLDQALLTNDLLADVVAQAANGFRRGAGRLRFGVGVVVHGRRAGSRKKGVFSPSPRAISSHWEGEGEKGDGGNYSNNCLIIASVPFFSVATVVYTLVVGIVFIAFGYFGRRLWLKAWGMLTVLICSSYLWRQCQATPERPG
jgi:hypothetical protein